MNTKNILEKFNKKKGAKPIFKLRGGGDVLGTEVDEHNQLHYIIRGEKGLSIEKAQNKHIITDETPSHPRIIKIRNPKPEDFS